MPLKTVPFDSRLWEAFPAAYGNACQDVKALVNAQQTQNTEHKYRRLDMQPKENWQIALDNLADNLAHQLSFYDAVYLAMPYLVNLLEEKAAENDFSAQLALLDVIGTCLATDIPYNTPLQPSADIWDEYQKSVQQVQEYTKAFLKQNQGSLKKLKQDDLTGFLIAAMSILGNRETAFLFYLTPFEECCFWSCKDCEFCDEDSMLEDLYDQIQPAPQKEWDGISFDDEYVWFSNLAKQLKAEVANCIPYHYGTFTCPECGRHGKMLDFEKAYTLGE